MSDARKKPVLILAPHPDDETFGCGGTIRMLVESGIAVDVVFMTRGEMGMEAGAQPSVAAKSETAQLRMAEAQAACAVLGVRSVQFLDGADTRLSEQPELAAGLAQLFERESYQRIFCPWQQDAHDDHMATFRLMRRAANARRLPMQFWLYEVWKMLPANTFVPIDNTIEIKRQASEQYKSQLALCNYQEAFLGLAAYRSLFCPSSRYAEAFFVCDLDELQHLT